MKIWLVLLAFTAVAAQDASGVYDLHDKGVVAPVAVKQVNPQYTDAAKDAHITGNVLLGSTVQPDGSLSDVEVIESLDKTYGLDGEAIKAMRQWRFKPGTKDGKAVAVRIRVEMTFTLK